MVFLDFRSDSEQDKESDPDPDTYQNETDPQQWLNIFSIKSLNSNRIPISVKPVATVKPEVKLESEADDTANADALALTANSDAPAVLLPEPVAAGKISVVQVKFGINWTRYILSIPWLENFLSIFIIIICLLFSF